MDRDGVGWRVFQVCGGLLRRCIWVVTLLVLVVAVGGVHAEAAASTRAEEFGRGVRLTGPWLAAAGDDPRWAQPGFDDSQWAHLQHGKPMSQQGFAGVQSIWYRTHVHLRSDAPAVSVYVENEEFNYSLFVNGVAVGGQGGMGVHQPKLLHTPEGFAVPPALVQGSGGDLVIAVHMSGGPVGFLDMPPMHELTSIELLSPREVPLHQSFRLAHDWSESFALTALNLLVGLCGLVIWYALREQQEYLALAVWVLCNAGTVMANFAAHLHAAAPLSAWSLLVMLFVAASSVGELEFMRLLLRRRQTPGWLGIEAVVFVIFLSDPLVSAGVLPLSFGAGEVLVRPLLTEVLIAVLLLRAALRGNPDAPVVLLPVALWSLTDVYGFVRLVLWFSVKVLIPEPPDLHVFSYRISSEGLADMLGLLSLILIILLRTIRLSRDRADLAAEVAAAEQLQLLLMARASRPMPGFRVETEYRPMQQVGGDFFLVQPCEEDNALVAIVGDVSGKGLQAAMRVSLILGVLQREVMGKPDRVLARLNRALLAQGDMGFTTACCVRLEADGSFCFANAGHLNPYVDEDELVSEGALPLGIDAEADYSTHEGQLRAGQRIVLLSDGVIEARSKKGELFGFERTRELVRMEAAAMADVAQRFGQEDDITVLSLALA